MTLLPATSRVRGHDPATAVGKSNGSEMEIRFCSDAFLRYAFTESRGSDAALYVVQEPSVLLLKAMQVRSRVQLS